VDESSTLEQEGELPENEASSLESSGMEEGDGAADMPAEPQQEGDSLPLAAIDVPVQFVVGTARVTLADLRRLNEGSLIENAVNRFYPRVVAQVNGRDVAEGEFLDIDGQVGFRVTKILA